MSIFISEAKLRKLTLMEYLNKFSEPVPVEQVKEHFNTTRTAIFEDLTDIQKQYPEITIVQTTKVAYLKIPSYLSMRHYYINWIKKSNAFKLFELLFNEPTLDKKSVATQLKMSQSSLYRIVEQYNSKLLDKFQIKITMTPLQIVGDEKNIRAFYTEFFREFYSCQDWPFRVDLETFSHFVRDAFSLLKVGVHYESVNDRIYTIAVNIVRTHQGYYISDMDSSCEGLYNHLDFDKTFMTDERFRNVTGLEPKFELVQQVFFPFIDKNFLQYGYTVAPSQKSISIMSVAHLNMKKLLNTYLKDFHFKASNEDIDTLSLELSSHGQFLASEALIDFIYFNPCEEFINYLKNHYPLEYNYLYQQLTDYSMHHYHFSSDYLVERLIQKWFLLAKSKNIDIIHTRASINVALYLTYSDEYNQYIYDWFECRLNDSINLELISNQYISTDLLENIEADLVISSTCIPESLRHWELMVINSFPTYSDFNTLTRILQKINQAKRKQLSELNDNQFQITPIKWLPISSN